ncbi:HD-GYP domain-containing protein, partial [Klebsiella pneumoniae]|uniref:HD-GYP domain-containing protein n=1 Tax=Klebsiella pneumoniae TaxID=573 RepID=UPI003CF72789
IGVPDAILNKPGRLTEEEFELMKQHPVIGYEICKPLMLSDTVLMIIRNHHEKLDGSGYPDGLKGGELPLTLRIVCVADAFDAMSSRR